MNEESVRERDDSILKKKKIFFCKWGCGGLKFRRDLRSYRCKNETNRRRRV